MTDTISSPSGVAAPQPVVGVAAVHVRNTNLAPSQLAAYRQKWPSGNMITGVIDAGDISSSTGYYGGSLPDHSNHWNEYLNGLMNIFPTGKDTQFVAPPDPSNLTSMVAESQNMVSGNHTNAWNTLQQNFAKAWRKGSSQNTYNS